MILEISTLREDKTSALISSAAVLGLSVPVGGLGGWSRASCVQRLLVVVGHGVLALPLCLYFLNLCMQFVHSSSSYYLSSTVGLIVI